jgi:hypothetical protein
VTCRTLSLFALLSVTLAAAPAAAQIGINGSRQAASTRDIEFPLNPLNRCGAARREANAIAGSATRAIERERITIDYRRARYAAGGLSDREAALLDYREEALDRSARASYRPNSYGRHTSSRRARSC